MKIATDDGSHLEAVVADAGEMFLGVTVRMNPSSSAAPVDRIDIHGVSSQDRLIPHYANDQELIGAVEAKVGGLVKVDKFAGTVMITRQVRARRRLADSPAENVRSFGGGSRLIVDLRGNTGGGIGGLRLMSYLTNSGE